MNSNAIIKPWLRALGRIKSKVVKMFDPTEPGDGEPPPRKLATLEIERPAFPNVPRPAYARIPR